MAKFRVSTEPFVLVFFILLPFAGTCYSCYRSGHLAYLVAAVVGALVLMGVFNLLERRAQTRYAQDRPPEPSSPMYDDD